MSPQGKGGELTAAGGVLLRVWSLNFMRPRNYQRRAGIT